MSSTEARLKNCSITYERERWPVGEVLRRNTLTQLRLFSTFDPSTLAMRRTFEDVLRVPGDQPLSSRTRFPASASLYPEPLFAPDQGLGASVKA